MAPTDRRPSRALDVHVQAAGTRLRAPGLARWLARYAPAAARGEVTVALVSDARIRALNHAYRGKDCATDVLSFFSGERGEPATRTGRRGAAIRARATERDIRAGSPHRLPTDRGTFLGDIVIAAGVASRQARAAGHSVGTELRVLALHGLLHLLGYDHEDPADGGRMARLERRLRAAGALREGLIERGSRPARPRRAPARAGRRRP